MLTPGPGHHSDILMTGGVGGEGVGVEVHMFYAKKIPEFVYLKNFYFS